MTARCSNYHKISLTVVAISVRVIRTKNPDLTSSSTFPVCERDSMGMKVGMVCENCHLQSRECEMDTIS